MNRDRMGVNSLLKIVTRQHRGCDLNPGPSAPESSTLNTRLPSHPLSIQWYNWKLEVDRKSVGKKPVPRRAHTHARTDTDGQREDIMPHLYWTGRSIKICSRIDMLTCAFHLFSSVDKANKEWLPQQRPWRYRKTNLIP